MNRPNASAIHRSDSSTQSARANHAGGGPGVEVRLPPLTRVRQVAGCVLGGLLLASTWGATPAAAAAPLRVVLLVDSSTAMGPMLTQFRGGLSAFLDELSPEVEVAMITTGGQLRVRVPPTSDRDRLRKAAAGFAPDGGGNVFLDAMLESDRRFLKSGPDCRPVFVIVSTDSDPRSEPRIDDYNKFVNDFLNRRGRAYAVVIRGSNMGLASRILDNLTSNTNGHLEVMALANGLSNRMKGIAAQISAQQ